MAKAKKLPSGNYRARVSYTGTDGKRHYESFTASTKKEAEFMAAEFHLNMAHRSDSGNWLLGEAIDEYIKLKEPVLSPTTISNYRKIRNNAFQELMDIPIRKITDTMLQQAVNNEAMRKPLSKSGTLSPKTVKNNYGLISSTLSHFNRGSIYHVILPKQARRIRSLPLPQEIYKAVKDTELELPVLLAMWLSFTESEIRGLTKSKSIDGDYITIREVLVVVDGVDVRKEMAKQETRNRRHKMPGRIKDLINQVDNDIIVPFTPRQIYHRFSKALSDHGLDHISFHDLRHVNASLMAMLRIPDKYAQERGGWKTDHVMKTVYMETFSEEREKVDELIDEYFEGFM